MRGFLKISLLIGMLMVLVAAAAWSAGSFRYRYANDKGEVLFADDLNAVPEKYRDQAMIVRTEEVNEQAQQAAEQERQQAAAQVQAAAEERQVQEVRQVQQAVAQVEAKKEQRLHIAWTGAALLLYVAMLIAMAKIEALREHERIVERVRTTLSVLLFAFLVAAYGKDLIRLFGAAGDTVAGMQQKSAERGKKAAQFYKEMEQMMEQAQAVQNEQETQIRQIEENN